MDTTTSPARRRATRELPRQADRAGGSVARSPSCPQPPSVIAPPERLCVGPLRIGQAVRMTPVGIDAIRLGGLAVSGLLLIAIGIYAFSTRERAGTWQNEVLVKIWGRHADAVERFWYIGTYVLGPLFLIAIGISMIVAAFVGG